MVDVRVIREGLDDAIISVEAGCTTRGLRAAAHAALALEAHYEWDVVCEDRGVLLDDALVDPNDDGSATPCVVEFRPKLKYVARERLRAMELDRGRGGDTPGESTENSPNAAAAAVAAAATARDLGITPGLLVRACDNADEDLIRLIVQSDCLGRGVVEREFRRACQRGAVDVAQAFLDEGVAVDARAPGRADDGCTALMLAVAAGREGMARTLLAAGAGVDVVCDEGDTALMRAAVCGGPEDTGGVGAALCKLLLDAGADANIASKSGETALACAARHGAEATCLRLLRHVPGVDVNAPTSAGVTPLMFAAESGYSSACRELAARGAQLHAQAGNGYTAMMYAAENDCLDVLEVLADLGADAGECVRMPH